MRQMLLTTVTILIFSAGTVCGQRRNASAQEMSYSSPDGALVATITSLSQPEATPECNLDVRTTAGRLLAQVSYTSDDGEHGYDVIKAQWTPDSQFFVFSLESSGGHQPWHSPVEYFNRKTNGFFDLDDVLNDAVINPEFVIGAPDTVTVDLFLAKKAVTVSLSALKLSR